MYKTTNLIKYLNLQENINLIFIINGEKYHFIINEYIYIYILTFLTKMENSAIMFSVPYITNKENFFLFKKHP